MPETMTTAEKLGRHSELMNQHGPKSQEVRDYLSENQTDLEFLELAATARDLKLAFMDAATNKLRVFIRNESGEPAAYCGPADSPETITAIGHFIKADLDSAIEHPDEEICLTLVLKKMTDGEVEALPDM